MVLMPNYIGLEISRFSGIIDKRNILRKVLCILIKILNAKTHSSILLSKWQIFALKIDNQTIYLRNINFFV